MLAEDFSGKDTIPNAAAVVPTDVFKIAIHKGTSIIAVVDVVAVVKDASSR